MGWNIMSVNIGITASPTIGGVLYDHAGYYSIFIVIAVLIALDILLRIVLVEKRPAAEWMEEDINTGENAPTQYGTFGPESAEPSQQKDSFIHIKNSSSSERRERSSPTKSNTGTGANTPTRSETLEPVSAGPSQQKDPSTHSTDAPSTEHRVANHSIDVPPSERHETSSSTQSKASIDHHDLRDDVAGKPASYPALLTLLSSPRILADLYATFVTVSLLVSFDSALPIFLERSFAWGSTEAGLIFFTITLPILGAPLAGKLTDRYQSHWIPATGFIIVGVLTALLQLVKHNSASQVALLVSLLTLNGRIHCTIPEGTLLKSSQVASEWFRPLPSEQTSTEPSRRWRKSVLACSANQAHTVKYSLFIRWPARLVCS